MLGSVNRLDLAGDPRNYTNYHEPLVKFRVISWIVFPSIAMSNSFGKAVYVYFNNDFEGYAINNALKLRELI